MKKIEQKVLKFIDEKNLIEENDNLLVALSGGPDSVFLFHFLEKYSKKLKISLGAIHINHRLRGKEADKDEKFCKELAEKKSLQFYSVKKNVKDAASKKGTSIEEAGRIVRYNEFKKILLKKGYTKIATAHNADENAETVLINLIKGTGLRGISGIPYRRGNIIRPLLILTKKEILDYLAFHNIEYREDLTNLEDNAERNFLRNKVIPLILERLNPSLSNTLLKSSEVFKNISDAIRRKVERDLENLLIKKKDYVYISISEIKKIENEYHNEIIRRIFEKEFDMQLSFDDCKKITGLTNKQSGRSIEIYNRIKVTKERDQLIIHKEKISEKTEAVLINKGDSIKINNKKFSITEVGTINPGDSVKKNIEYISGDNTGDTFLIRNWIYGDRFFPFGMKGSKKISDFLSEQKITSLQKEKQMILLNEDRIVWVIGLRLDERFRVTSDTKKIYRLCLS